MFAVIVLGLSRQIPEGHILFPGTGCALQQESSVAGHWPQVNPKQGLRAPPPYEPPAGDPSHTFSARGRGGLFKERPPLKCCFISRWQRSERRSELMSSEDKRE